MSSQRPVQVLRVTVLVATIILGYVSISNALDVQVGEELKAMEVEVQFGAEVTWTGSDNIYRAPVGQETDGYRLTTEGTLNISANPGSGKKLDFAAKGGWEILDDGEVNDDFNSFSIELNALMPWSRTGYIEGSFIQAEEIVDPGITDISQLRARTRRSEINLGIGKISSRKLQWSAGLSDRTESRFDREFQESGMDLGWVITTSPQRTFSLDLGLLTGTEDVDEDSWDGSSLTLSTTRKIKSNTSTEYRLEWEESRLERGVGTTEKSDRISLVYGYDSQVRSKWFFSSDIGLDGIQPRNGVREWMPRFRFDAEGDLGQKTLVNIQLSSSSSLQDPLDERNTRTTNTVLDAGLTWRFSRTFSVIPRARYRHAQIFGDAIADRTDVTTITQLDTRWRWRSDWSFDIALIEENLKSTQSSYDLSESRLELGLVGTFF